MVNPNADEIVLPCFVCVGNLIPVSAVLVALEEPVLRDLAGPSGRHCNRVPPLSGGGRSAVAQEPSPSVRECFPGAQRTCYRAYHIGTA